MGILGTNKIKCQRCGKRVAVDQITGRLVDHTSPHSQERCQGS